MPEAEVIDIKSRLPARPVCLESRTETVLTEPRDDLISLLLAQLIRSTQEHAQGQQAMLSVLSDRIAGQGVRP